MTTHDANGSECGHEETATECPLDHNQETDRKLIVFRAQKDGLRTAHVVNLARIEPCAIIPHSGYQPMAPSRNSLRREPELIQAGWLQESHFPDGTHSPVFVRGHNGTIKKISVNEEAHNYAASDLVPSEVNGGELLPDGSVAPVFFLDVDDQMKRVEFE